MMEQSKRLLLEPWAIDFETRKKMFFGAKKEGKRLALYYDKELDVSTFRYRCFNVMQATRKSKKWQAVFFLRDEIEKMKEMIPECDLLVLGRQARWNEKIGEMVEEARRRQKPVLLDLDDLVFDKRYLHVVMNTIGNLMNLGYWIPYFNDIHETGKHCDGYLVTNEFLGERIARTFGRPYRVIRNSLNDEQVAASEAYLGMKEWLKEGGVSRGGIVGKDAARRVKGGATEGRGKKKSGTAEEEREAWEKKRFMVGYFGGTPTHVNDLEVALPEILAFLDDFPEARLKIVGYMDFTAQAQKYLKEGRIIFEPFVDFRKLQRLMTEVDVNIAPLVVNEFTNCKSELKFFEAGAVETTTIASPTYTYQRAITDGENGFLAQQGEWYDKLKFLYDNPKKNREIARRAREYALKHYYGKEFLEEVEAAYEFFTEKRHDAR